MKISSGRCAVVIATAIILIIFDTSIFSTRNMDISVYCLSTEAPPSTSTKRRRWFHWRKHGGGSGVLIAPCAYNTRVDSRGKCRSVFS